MQPRAPTPLSSYLQRVRPTSPSGAPRARTEFAWAGVVAATLLFAASCTKSTSDAAEDSFAAAKKRDPARVLVEPIARREMLQRLETTTRVESESSVQVFPRASGVVVQLHVEEGQSVEANQILARLDDRDARLRLDDAQAALKEAQDALPKLDLATRESKALLDNAKRAAEQSERDHERNVAISQGGPDSPGLISSKDLDASKLALDRARSDLATAELALERAKVEQANGANAVVRAEVAVSRAELELSYTEVVAPVAGVVAERNIKLGDTVSNAAAAFTLTDLTRLRAVFHRPQRELRMFAAGFAPGAAGDSHGESSSAELSIVATAEALPGKTFAGRIERVAPTIDAASGNFRVTARLETNPTDGGAGRLLPGMLVRLEIVTDRRADALVAPKRAIRREGDRSTIQVVRNGLAHSIEVAEGFGDDAWVEVQPRADERLDVGDLVVVVGNRDLEEGAEVIATDAAGVVLQRAPSAEPQDASGNAAASSAVGAANGGGQ